MNGNLVSVIVPTFNRAYCLARTLDSALKQTHSNLEIIVIDDGSTDQTQDLIRSSYAREPRVKYIHQENAGVSAARNRGLATIQGDYVAFLDSDDVWKPWKLQAQLACMKFLPSIGMVWSDFETLDARGNVSSQKHIRTKYQAYRWFTNEQLFTESFPLNRFAPELEDAAGGTLYTGDIYSQMIMGSLVHTSTVLMRRDRFEKVKKFDENLRFSGEDYDFHLRTCREGPVGFLNLAAMQYQQDMPDSLGRYRYMTAYNFLTTVAGAIERDRKRIKLPKKMIHHVLAEGNSWVGEELFEQGDHRDARSYLLKSLSHRIGQPRIAMLLGLSLMPRGLSHLLRRTYRGAKTCLGKNRAATACV